MRLILLLLAGCFEQVDQRWELDHDHVVAVRATPPAVMPGQQAQLDALIAHTGKPTTRAKPIGAAGPQVPDTDPLRWVVSADLDGTWYVTAPSEAALAEVRARDGLAADAPVPLRVVMAFGTPEEPLYATKIVWLGATADNPSVPAMAVDGQLAADRIDVPMGKDVYVSVAAEGARVNWLTSCGELFQDDVATAFIRIKEECSGELAVVIRGEHGGVAWRVWPLSAVR